MCNKIPILNKQEICVHNVGFFPQELHLYFSTDIMSTRITDFVLQCSVSYKSFLIIHLYKQKLLEEKNPIILEIMLHQLNLIQDYFMTTQVY